MPRNRPHIDSFPFFPDDWLSSKSVRCMSNEQRGIYMLSWSWPDGIKNNDDLWRLTGCVTKEVFDAIFAPILSQFEEVRGTLFHPKLRRLYKGALAYRRLQRVKGKLGGLAAAEHRLSSGGGRGTAPNPESLTPDSEPASGSYVSVSNSRLGVQSTTPRSSVLAPISGVGGTSSSMSQAQGQKSANQPESAEVRKLRSGVPGEDIESWCARMAKLGTALRRQRAYRSSTTSDMWEGKTFYKMQRERWQASINYAPSREEIQECMIWALSVSSYWSKKDVLDGSEGFARAFKTIHSQWWNYFHTKNTNDEISAEAAAKKPDEATPVKLPKSSGSDPSLLSDQKEL